MTLTARLIQGGGLALVLAVSLLQATDYEMDVRLDPAARTVSGVETLHWVNSTRSPATDLWFHLYYNAWRDPQSSFLNSNRMITRAFPEWGPEDWAYNEILSLIWLDGEGAEVDLSSGIEYVQPDDQNPCDRTVMRVPLPRAVEPGAAARVRIEFKSKIPRTFARTGSRGEYFFIAQWFPKLGVFQDDGSWNCHQFIQTEFFADFGTYDVRLTVPLRWLVGATGQRTGYRENGDGSATHHYYQEQVHDFAWTTSPYFLEYRQRFEHPFLRPVDMRLLLMPDHRGQQERYFNSTRAALQYYGEWFGEYPYGHLTIVDPAFRSMSRGMEYPTLFTGGTRWLNPAGSHDPEGVTVHECGHQFWYGMVANNEFEDAWLDEGINSYSAERVMMQVYGPAPRVRRYLDDLVPLLFRDLPRAPSTASGLAGHYSDLKWEIMSRPSWQYGPASRRKPLSPSPWTRIYGGGSYTLNSYDKPALMLRTLERYLGWKTFQRALSTFFQRWKFRHPRPADFFAVVDEISGQRLDWFWEQTYNDSLVFDYAVDAVDERGKGQEVMIRRWGEGVFPVEVETVFEDGTALRQSWDGRARWMRYRHPETPAIERVRVDPGRVLALDVNLTNNSWSRTAPAVFSARKWALKWMIWLQNVMELFAFFS